MGKILALSCFIVGLAISLVSFPIGAVAVLTTSLFSVVIILLIKHYTEASDFLVQVFLFGLLARVILGTLIYVYDLTGFFGGDSITYDSLGTTLADLWLGNPVPDEFWARKASAIGGSGWGMHYLVGSIYFTLGHNMLAAQFICALFGAATPVLTYLCAQKIFGNSRVSKTAALIVAFSPSMIIWSSNLFKDGPTIFLLMLVMVSVLSLLEKFSYASVFTLFIGMLGILSLRFYIFYMVASAVLGSFIVGTNNSVKSIVGRLSIIMIVGLTLTYVGAVNTATTDFEKFGSLQAVQNSRMDLARSANSGFAEEADVSTAEGAITFLPIGLTYLLLAPFPWGMNNLRQLATLPEMLLWWASIPILISGIWYTIKNRLRKAVAILIFTVMLTLAYSVFQGNVGTAYRHRAQIQVFLFIFISVGLTLRKERKENENASMKFHINRIGQKLQPKI